MGLYLKQRKLAFRAGALEPIAAKASQASGAA
jgi:hypothetical protein